MAPKSIYKPVSTPEEIRLKARSMLLAAVEDEKIAVYLEKASWNYSVDFCKKREIALNWDNFAFRNIYTQKILSVRYNIRLRPDILEQMIAGQASIRQFVEAKPHEICPEKWAEAFEQSAKRALRFSDASCMDPKDMPDGMLQCRKCGSKKTSYYELQTRSADEPKHHGLKSITPRTSGHCSWKIRLDFRALLAAYVSC
ncbi:transcription elongation factor S-II [Acanthocystis turfacea Chlorella virus Canal-1]|nr:transcription elongation factor S-II [Acanthocystis turfacea Chlorella virus Canal-1]